MFNRTTTSVLLSVTLLALGLACAWPGAEAQEPAPGEHADNAPDDRIAQGATGAYAVHEWGLVRYTPDVTEMATSDWGFRPPSPYDHMAAPAKPLLYFYPQDGFDADTEIDVTVTIRGGSVREAWPTPQGGAQPGGQRESHTWSDLRIQPDVSCGSELAPTVRDEACTSLTDGGVCEAAELVAYLQPVSHCLSYGSQRAPVLVYNGYVPSPNTPVTVDTAGVTNPTTHAVGPVWAMNGTELRRFERIEPDATAPFSTGIVVNGPLSVDPGLLAALRDAGLTDTEAADFVAAWRIHLLAIPYPWQAFGLLSRDAADEAYPLTLDPAPAEVVRVLAFTVEGPAAP